MPNAITSSLANLGTTHKSRNAGNLSPLYQTGSAFVMAPSVDRIIAPLLAASPLEEVPFIADKTVATVAVRRLNRELAYAQQELHDLQQTLPQDLLASAMRVWLLPLMAIGLGLSLYGSFAASTIVEWIATCLILLWSLGAFWYIYSSEKRREEIACAHKAEIEIWSGRIAELQRCLVHAKHVVETEGERQG
jgi:hypothetical protein